MKLTASLIFAAGGLALLLTATPTATSLVIGAVIVYAAGLMGGLAVTDWAVRRLNERIGSLERKCDEHLERSILPARTPPNPLESMPRWPPPGETVEEALAREEREGGA